jgi:hypothetical protein
VKNERIQEIEIEQVEDYELESDVFDVITLNGEIREFVRKMLRGETPYKVNE